MDVPELKICEIDDSAGEENLWKNQFPELENDVVATAFVDENLGHTNVSNDDFTYATSIATLNNWSMSVVADAQKIIAMCVGICYKRN